MVMANNIKEKVLVRAVALSFRAQLFTGSAGALARIEREARI